MVYYDTGWYIGRVLQVLKDQCSIKFLKFNLDNYVWPKVNEVQEVFFRYIFYGPIDLIGSYPFQIKRSDNLNIEKKYKQLKKEFQK